MKLKQGKKSGGYICKHFITYPLILLYGIFLAVLVYNTTQSADASSADNSVVSEKFKSIE